MVIKINKRIIKYLLIVLIALIGGFMFHLDRNMNMDFNRYQDLMEVVRFSNLSLIDFLLDETNLLKWINITLPFMYSFNVLFYLISTGFENNYVMVWASVLIDYSIIAYIAYDWRREARYTKLEILITIGICFVLLPFIHVVSGLRTATSACFMALAVYKFLYQDKGFLLFGLYSFLSITFHPVSLFAIPIALVLKLNFGKFAIFVIIFSSLFISQIASVFSRSGNVILMAIATKYETYTAVTQFRAYRFVTYGIIIFALLLLFYYLFLYENNSSKSKIGNNEYQIFSFLACYSALLIGNYRSYELVARGGYLLGALAPILMSLFFSKNYSVNWHFAVLVKFAVVGLVIYMGLSYIVYYHAFFSLLG